MKLLTIQYISELSGVGASTLRAWERRYSAIQPDRTESNRRQYSYEDLERIRLLKELTHNGFNISQIALLKNQELRKLYASFEKSAHSDKTAKRVEERKISTIESKPVIEKLLELIKKMDLNQLNNQLTLARLSNSAPDFVIHIASPLFQKVGHLVYEGEMSISQEHALSALLRNQITQMVLTLAPLVQTDLPQIALTTREGDHHEFGIFLSQALCIYEGFPVVYLGSNLPASALAETLNALRIEFCVIGSTPLPQEYVFITLRNYLKEVLGEIHFPVKIWLGGYLDDVKENDIKQYQILHSKSFSDFHRSLIEIKKQINEEET